MILFSLLTLVVLFVLLILLFVTGVLGAGFLIVFGDVIVFVLLLYWVIKKLIFRRKRR